MLVFIFITSESDSLSVNSNDLSSGNRKLVTVSKADMTCAASLSEALLPRIHHWIQNWDGGLWFLRMREREIAAGITKVNPFELFQWGKRLAKMWPIGVNFSGTYLWFKMISLHDRSRKHLGCTPSLKSKYWNSFVHVLYIFQLTFWLSNQVLKNKTFYFLSFWKSNELMTHRLCEPCLMQQLCLT